MIARAAALVAIAACALATGCGDETEPTASAPEATATTAPAPEETTTSSTTAEAEPAPSDRGPEPPDKPAGPEQPEEQIERPLAVEDVIVAVLTRAGSPEWGCEQLVTDRFVKEAYGGHQGCVAARSSGGLASSVGVEAVEERAQAATAIAVPQGGPYDGIEVEVSLIPDPEIDDAWLVDSLLADVPAGP